MNQYLKALILWKRSISAYIRRFSSFLAEFAAFLIALLGGIALFSAAIFSGLLSGIISVGLDPARAQLITALLLATGAALTGAVAGRRKVGAMLGAWLVFCVGYLAGFVQLELQPARDPGGHLELLNSGALLHTSLVIAALAVLATFVGAAIGVALRDALLNPPFRLIKYTWRRTLPARVPDTVVILSQEATIGRTSDAKILRRIIASLSGIAVIVASLVLATGASDLLTYAPDVGLHTVPVIPHKGVSPAHGTIVADSLVSPALNGQKKPFLVYLPPSYNTPQGATRRYPVLYLLHGSPGTDKDWFTGGKADQSADTLIALGKIPELILVLPDGNGRAGQTSEWANSFDHSQNIETYVTRDLVQYVDAKYRTIPQAAYRAIGGNSMGGFGATNIAIHHPDVFGFVISLGGYYRAEGGIWGNNLAYMQANSPIDVLPSAKSAWKLHIFLGAATRDQPYYNYARQFASELDHLHMPYHFDVQKGFHSWKIWQIQIYNALAWLQWGS